MSSIERLNIEKSLIGIFLSAHPLDEYEFEVTQLCNITSQELTQLETLRTPDGRRAAAAAATEGDETTLNSQLTTTLHSQLYTLHFSVANRGEMAGAEVVQLYVRAQHSTLARPVKELRGFKRVYLEPGEEQTVTFDITPETLGYYTDLTTFTVEPGTYDLFLNTDFAGSITIE